MKFQTRSNLLIIPTYNEAGNIEILLNELATINREFDVLFVDDNSPDGTATKIEKIASSGTCKFNIELLSRVKKDGIGSAHRAGIMWAYDRGYDYVTTMDADLTHTAEFIGNVLNAEPSVVLVLTSRFLDSESISEWSNYRKIITHTGHFLTSRLLNMPYDVTGGLRRYSLRRIPKSIFSQAQCKGYSFLYEIALYIHYNNYKIDEIPVTLPIRVYGKSKMNFIEMLRSLIILLKYAFYIRVIPSKFLCSSPANAQK